MRKLIAKNQPKVILFGLIIFTVGLIAAIAFTLLSTSDTKTIAGSSGENAIVSPNIQKSGVNESKVEVQPIVTVPEANTQSAESQGTNQTQEAKQPEALVRSIQEGQPGEESKPTPPPKPVPQGDVTYKNVKPTYKEQDVKPQQNQPKMGDRNDKGEIYIEGFGWVKDEGGGGKGTTIGKPGDQLTGNKVGVMD